MLAPIIHLEDRILALVVFPNQILVDLVEASTNQTRLFNQASRILQPWLGLDQRTKMNLLKILPINFKALLHLIKDKVLSSRLFLKMVQPWPTLLVWVEISSKTMIYKLNKTVDLILFKQMECYLSLLPNHKNRNLSLFQRLKLLLQQLPPRKEKWKLNQKPRLLQLQLKRRML